MTCMKQLIKSFSPRLVQTGWHGGGDRERPAAHLEGFAPSRRKETFHQGTVALVF